MEAFVLFVRVHVYNYYNPHRSVILSNVNISIMYSTHILGIKDILSTLCCSDESVSLCKIEQKKLLLISKSMCTTHIFVATFLRVSQITRQATYVSKTHHIANCPKFFLTFHKLCLRIENILLQHLSILRSDKPLVWFLKMTASIFPPRPQFRGYFGS